METLRGLFVFLTETVFKFAAGFILAFLAFPIRPYRSVRAGGRLANDYRMSTTTLVMFAFLFFALSLGRPGSPILRFGQFGDALQNLWQINSRTVELLYVVLFVFGMTVLTIIVGNSFRRFLKLKNPDGQIFIEIYDVFVTFIICWFVLLAWLTSRLREIFWTKESWERFLGKNPVQALSKSLEIPNISEIIFNPALYLVFAMAGYFGFRILATLKRRRDLQLLPLTRRSHNSTQKGPREQALRRAVIVASIASAAFIMIIGSVLYLATLSVSLFKTANPESDFKFLANCFSDSDRKLYITLHVKNNRNERVALKSIFIEQGSLTLEAFKLDPTDLFWMSKKGLFLDQGETRYYRLRINRPYTNASACKAVDEVDKTQLVTSVRAEGDSLTLAPGTADAAKP